MKLQRLAIQNFRGISGEESTDNMIDFSSSDIVFLIGQNNAGKSSFLRAYEFFINPKQVSLKEDFFNYDTDNAISIEAHFLKELVDESDEDLAKNGKSSDPSWSEKWTDSKSSIIKIRKLWNASGKLGDKQTYDPVAREWVDGGFGGFDTLLAKYSPTPISINAMETASTLEEKVNKIINDQFLKKAENDFPSEYTHAKKAIELLQNKVVDSDGVVKINTNINKQFKELFNNLTLEIKPKDGEKLNILKAIEKSHSVNVRRDGVERAETFIQNGHGIIRQALFNFLAFLIDTKENSNHKEYIILFEEPELYLHPKAVYKLRKCLYALAENSAYQVLCATHSSLMIDISKPHSSLVRVTKHANERTKTFQVGDEVFQKGQNKQIAQMINRFNGFICESFYASKVILVEGDTEAIVFRDLLDRFASHEEIFVLNTGSKNNIPFFQEVLTHFNITHWIFHDSDEPSKGNGSAWTLNQKIWDKVVIARDINPSLSNRRVMITNFEVAHSYTPNPTDGKPLSAYKFVQKIDSLDSSFKCCEYLNDVINTSDATHDQEWISNNMPPFSNNTKA